MPKLIPVPDELSKPFWDAVNERRLIVQNCTACTERRGGLSMLQYPPQKACANCGSADHLVWHQVSGRGRITDYIVMHDTRLRRLQADQPFNIAVIELEEDPGIKMFSHLPGTPADEVPVGGSVQVIFEEVAPGQLIHEWKVV